jgi:transcriptional regulator with XRE-family HTH domain/tetratricopeptide (TPR) repeat protein
MSASQVPTFAETLRRLRLAAGLTQEELAEKAQLSARAVSDLERGERTRPRKETVKLLADALNLSAHDRGLLTAAATQYRLTLVDRLLAGAGHPGVVPLGDAKADERTVPALASAPVVAVASAPASVSSLVGRRDALAAIQAVWSETASASEPHAVLIMGESGIGKSRLAEAALAWAAHHDHDGQPISTATARCYLAEGDLPFAPVLTWLRSPALWPEVLALEPVWQSEVARLLPELLVARPALPQPPPMPDRWQRPRLFEALARALTHSGRPLLMVLDDLQWCEQDTLEWLRYLLRRPAAAPLLVVGTARVEEITPGHPLVALCTDLRHDQQLSELPLEPLAFAETAELGAHVAGHALNTEQAERLYAETEGSPLFVVELVRAGLLDRTPPPEHAAHAAARAGGSDASRVPPTLHAVVSWRLHQLSPAAHELAGVAAVVGRAFSVGLLAQASRRAGADGRDDEAVVRALDELRQRRIVRAQGAPGTQGMAGAVRGADTYDFSHDKLREGVYVELSPARRQVLHRRVARALEVVSADALDEVSAQLAAHYEAGGEPVLACAALERAGQLAVRQGVPAQARAYLRRAVAVAPASEQMRCYEALGDSWGQFDAPDSYHEALARWRAQPTDMRNPLVGARLLRKLLYAWQRADQRQPMNCDELAAMADEARQLAEHAGDADEQARVRVAALCLSWRCGAPSWEDVLQGRAEVLAAAEHLAAHGDWESYSEALDTYGVCLQQVGAFAESLDLYERRLAVPTLSLVERGDAISGIALTSYFMGDYERSMATIRTTVEHAPPDAPLLLGMGWIPCWAAWLSGQWDELGFFVATNRRLTEEAVVAETLTSLLCYWGVLHVALAREDQTAAAEAVAMLELLQPSAWAFVAAPLVAASLLAAYRADDPAPLLARPAEVWSVGTPIPFFSLMFLNERGIAAPRAALDAVGPAERQRAHFPRHCVQIAEAVASNDPARLADAVEQAETGGLVPHAARMRIVLAQRTGDPTHLERARPVLERLGDRQFLRRLERVATELG